MTLVHKLYASVLEWTDRYTQGGFEAIQSGVSKWDKSEGRRVEVIRHTDTRTAVAKGIENGALKVRFEDGSEEFVIAGEVKLIP